jgi:hypothetical protein
MDGLRLRVKSGVVAAWALAGKELAATRTVRMRIRGRRDNPVAYRNNGRVSAIFGMFETTRKPVLLALSYEEDRL